MATNSQAEAYAKRIADLEAEVERLTRERDEARADWVALVDENARTEAALREIEQATKDIPEQNCAIANQIARAALRGEEGK